MDFGTTLSQVNGWSVPDRIRFVQAVLDGIADEQQPFELTDEMKREIDRRLAEHEANPDDVVPWEEVYAAAMARYKQ
jgi:putative addiction module component (TIGR02574 family)